MADAHDLRHGLEDAGLRGADTGKSGSSPELLSCSPPETTKSVRISNIQNKFHVDVTKSGEWPTYISEGVRGHSDGKRDI